MPSAEGDPTQSPLLNHVCSKSVVRQDQAINAILCSKQSFRTVSWQSPCHQPDLWVFSKSLVNVPGIPCFIYLNMPGFSFQLPKVER
jgi:hypothetical protein